MRYRSTWSSPSRSRLASSDAIVVSKVLAGTPQAGFPGNSFVVTNSSSRRSPPSMAALRARPTPSSF